MNVKETQQDGLTYTMEVTVPANDIGAEQDKKLVELSKTVKEKGFRAGKVPLSMVKKKYGRAVMGEILEKVVNSTSTKVMKDKNLRPAMQPKIEVKEFDEGKDLIYTMTVEVLPEIKLADFKKFELEKPVTEASEKEIDDALAKLAANAQHTKTVERKSKDGDTVNINFKGRTADDNKEHDGMQADGHNLKLGSGQFIPGFEEQLIGKKAGETVEVKVKFPEEYGAKELAGREAIFDVDVNEVREPSEAEINDEFAKNFGMDNLKALKEAVKEQLQKEFDNMSRMIVKRHLLDTLDEAHDMDIPPTMLEMETRNILDQLELERQRNPEAEEVSEEDKSDYEDIAERRVRLGLVLAEIGRQNSLSVSDIELQKAVIAEAQKYPGQEKEVFDYYAKNRNALESMRAPLFEDKAIDYILELAKINEKKVDSETLAKTLEEQGEYNPVKEKKSKSGSSAKKSSTKKTATKAKADKKEEHVHGEHCGHGCGHNH